MRYRQQQYNYQGAQEKQDIQEGLRLQKDSGYWNHSYGLNGAAIIAPLLSIFTFLQKREASRYNAAMWSLGAKIGLKGKRIYLDHAATTPVLPEVLTAMAPYWHEHFGNPGALYQEGVEAMRALLSARTTIARQLSVRAEEITFTSGGTEANNLAIFGIIAQLRAEGRAPAALHVISTKLEHSSILEPLRRLEAEGVSVSYVPVHESGLIDLAALRAALRPETVLITVHLVNNEIGVIQPLRDIARVLAEYYPKDKRPRFHTDACQAPLYLDPSPERFGVDMLTLDGQKIGGPKGIGLLVHRHHIAFQPIMVGGGQERGMRPGTEPVPLVVGLATAIRFSAENREARVDHVSALRDRFIAQLLQRIPQAVLNGSATERIANNVNISIPGVDTEFLVIHLDKEGVAVSTKSTCLVDEPASTTVAALGRGDAHARSTLRITLGPDTTWKELTYALDALEKSLEKLDKQ